MKYTQVLLFCALALFGVIQAEMADEVMASSEPLSTLVTPQGKAEENAPAFLEDSSSTEGRVVYVPVPVVPYPLLEGLPIFTAASGVGASTAETRNIGASGGLSLGPVGAGFGAGLRPSGFFVGGGAGYSGNVFRPYNYQQHQAPYVYTPRPYRNQYRFF